MPGTTTSRAAMLAVVVAALGYFVDIYDLILFGMVRAPSLTDLGVPREQLLDQGVYLINMQMGGMLVGGILWGIIGDKRGRLSVLFGSITLYSIANIANGMATGVDSYAVCRLIAGIGLAGELGAGITLVSELMGKHNRGIGTTLVAAIGVSGGLLAGLIGGAFPSIGAVYWRNAYYIGGGLGLALLALRIGVVESGMFHTTKKTTVARGNFFQLFRGKRLRRYLAIICVGIPIWYVIGIMFTFSKEIGGALGLSPEPNPARALFFCYGGCTVGGVLCGLLSQRLKSRKRALATFIAATALVMIVYYAFGGASSTLFYGLCFLGGCATGYWAVFMGTAAELFGTNLRATVATTVPNFVRGSVPLLTLSFKALIPSLGIVAAAASIGAATIVIAAIGLAMLPETFHVDLDFHETDEPPLPRATAV